MVKRALLLFVAFCLGVVLLYLSQFWIFELWGSDGLFGLQWLPPGGDLLARWLRGTPAAPFDLVIWAVLVFLVTTFVQRLFKRLT